jgi:hypothetical protein
MGKLLCYLSSILVAVLRMFPETASASNQTKILFRRIGKNELAAIQACSDLVDAQKQYYDRAPDGFSKEYARKLVSDVGRHNGLYWEGTADQFDSPINPLIAYARQNRPVDQV